jgi:hypothetical protein
MDSETLQLGLAQLAAIIFSSGTLIARPQLALAIVLFVGLILAFSIASSLAIGMYYRSRDGEPLSAIHAAKLGTHIGGIICYAIMIYQSFAHLI